MRALIIEDDQETAEYMREGLRQSGWQAEHAPDGPSGLIRAASGGFDAIIVDRMLPGLDGLGVVTALRASGVATPILFLSALAGVDDRVKGLKAGADDYLTKPYAFSELLARLEALQRRAKGAQKDQSRLSYLDLEMDLVSREVRRAGRIIELKPKEFALLEYLMRHAGQVVTRTMLLEQVWELDFDPATNVVDVHISRLRRKIDNPPDAPLIQTVRGAGYSLREAS